MNKTVKTLLTIAAASLMLVACDKKEENTEKKATTIEEIQKEKGNDHRRNPERKRQARPRGEGWHCKAYRYA